MKKKIVPFFYFKVSCEKAYLRC